MKTNLFASGKVLCIRLLKRLDESDEKTKSLEALGRWLTRFSPVVAIEGADALLLDVGGSERLFGGMDKLLARVARALQKLHIPASTAIAPTPGAAWAIARFYDGRIVTEQELASALAALPPAALRIDPAMAGELEGLGIDTIGRLMAIPREALPVRFGPDLLRRLDQAMGRSPEPLAAIPYRTPIAARIKWEGKVDALEAIWIVLRRLIDRLVTDLGRRCCGARKIEAWFFQEYPSPPLHKTVLLSRPSRDPANLFNLLRCALETLQTGEGFIGIQLDVPVFERLAEEQIQLTGREEQEAGKELSHLIERLQARLDPEAVQRAVLVESHLPEKAWKGEEVNSCQLPVVSCQNEGSGQWSVVSGQRQTRQDHARAHLTSPSSFSIPHSAFSISSGTVASCQLSVARKKTGRAVPPPSAFSISPSAFSISPSSPLHLLALPTEIGVMASPGEESRPVSFTHEGQVHRLAHVIGPERIAGVWWEGHNKTRDYFDATDNAGLRFWIFRVMQTGKWYLQGRF